ncbi:hypothetical protein Nepgr_028139 [Nepenthes gracilis]|uniref:Uncharacterized protein n=1 Tax=Nepenthes gracilis TaxID=150966 RepID=A0AAD3Y491_NEPGR|nr:hypothetical protein Nepgr_028139 [Nepenthes gracilis]
MKLLIGLSSDRGAQRKKKQCPASFLTIDFRTLLNMPFTKLARFCWVVNSINVLRTYGCVETDANAVLVRSVHCIRARIALSCYKEISLGVVCFSY